MKEIFYITVTLIEYYLRRKKKDLSSRLYTWPISVYTPSWSEHPPKKNTSHITLTYKINTTKTEEKW